MKRAPQALAISPDRAARQEILSEVQTGSIRFGYRDYTHGTAYLCCHLEPWVVMVDITYVRRCRLSNVTRYDMYMAGFRTRRAMVARLRFLYPRQSIRPTTPVTVVGWANLRGALVIRRDMRRALDQARPKVVARLKRAKNFSDVLRLTDRYPFAKRRSRS